MTTATLTVVDSTARQDATPNRWPTGGDLPSTTAHPQADGSVNPHITDNSELSTSARCVAEVSGMMSIMRFGVALARMALAVLAVIAVGCTGHAAGPNTSSVSVGSPTTTAAPSSSHSSPAPAYPADVPLTGHNVKPGEKPPLYPVAAKERSQAGANAFAEFFMRTLDWAYATTDPSYMKHYYASSCGLCSGLATGITKTAQQNRWYLGGRLSIRSTTRQPIGDVTAPADFCSQPSVDITATAVVDKTAKVFNGQGALTAQTFKICSKMQDNAWHVTYMIGTS